MGLIKMRAIEKHAFGTGDREVGDVYNATLAECSVLVFMGWAEEVEKKKDSSREDEDDKSEIDGGQINQLKRTYMRKDLTAKD